ncbi:fluoride efflux transporter CrcB [Maribacter sp. 2307ULW6-5]|uniref:fluoride efflux transporter CrcB n=1 Tax=Maribacter sp. 2307ULW6-5 TaxID=3386275 RepID=UPI0039BCB598
MKHIFLVFLGGGLGSALRYWMSKTLNPYFSNFYLGTFSVNILGCLLMGILLGATLRPPLLPQYGMLLLATGFCGGFTTFSAFAFEGHALLREGNITYFLLYVLGSLAVGLLAVGLGVWLSRTL